MSQYRDQPVLLAFPIVTPYAWGLQVCVGVYHACVYHLCVYMRERGGENTE